MSNVRPTNENKHKIRKVCKFWMDNDSNGHENHANSDRNLQAVLHDRVVPVCRWVRRNCTCLWCPGSTSADCRSAGAFWSACSTAGRCGNGRPCRRKCGKTSRSNRLVDDGYPPRNHHLPPRPLLSRHHFSTRPQYLHLLSFFKNYLLWI